MRVLSAFVIFMLISGCRSTQPEVAAGPPGASYLSADRSAMAELRKDIPEPIRLANDEQAFWAELFDVSNPKPADIREKFQKRVRKARDQFNGQLRKEREDYTAAERRKREAFVARAKKEREEFLRQKPKRDEQQAFFTEQDRVRREFFAEERENRAEFESTVRERRTQFEDHLREKQNDFNARIKDLQTKLKEKPVKKDSTFEVLDSTPGQRLEANPVLEPND